MFSVPRGQGLRRYIEDWVLLTRRINAWNRLRRKKLNCPPEVYNAFLGLVIGAHNLRSQYKFNHGWLVFAPVV